MLPMAEGATQEPESLCWMRGADESGGHGAVRAAMREPSTLWLRKSFRRIGNPPFMLSPLDDSAARRTKARPSLKRSVLQADYV